MDDIVASKLINDTSMLAHICFSRQLHVRGFGTPKAHCTSKVIRCSPVTLPLRLPSLAEYMLVYLMTTHEVAWSFITPNACTIHACIRSARVSQSHGANEKNTSKKPANRY